MKVSRTYIVNDFMKTPCRIGCDEAVPFGPCCPHQHWFPIPHRVTVDMDGDRELRISCTEGKKAGGPRCRQWDGDKEDPCPHVKLVRDVLAGTAEDREKGRVSLQHINQASQMRPRCPNCRETWGVSEADGAARGRWKRAHRKMLKQEGEEMPEQLWMCRHPNCADNAGRPWAFVEGTEERPKGGRRHEAPVREGFGWH